MKSTQQRNDYLADQALGKRNIKGACVSIETPTPFKFSSVGLACCILVAIANPAVAAPLIFSQVPAGNGSRLPAPNVIITVDDSGSMAWDVTTDNTTSVVANRKISLLKAALKAEFGDGSANSGNIPDGRIRLAWQAMHNNGSSPGAGSLTAGGTNTIKSFSGAHRTNFNSFIDSLSANNGTPSLTMMNNVYNYMRTPAGTNSPWADTPGTAQSTPYMACRRTYHVFMTDGAWNGQSNSDRVSKGDSTTQTLPEWLKDYQNTSVTNTYNINSDQARVYKDAWGDGDQVAHPNKASTLADYAFRNWATDLQDGTGGTQAMANIVTPLRKIQGTTNIWGTPPATSTTPCTNANDCTPLNEVWHPKNDPATWQHVNQYTIGFGLGAVNWPYRKGSADTALYTSTTAANINARTTPADWDYNNTTYDPYGGDFVGLARGKLVWPDVYSYDTSPSSAQQDQRTVELWHAAINGRGRYYPAKTAAALTQAFSDILDTVIGDTNTSLLSIATSSSYLRSGLDAYIGGYDPVFYAGTLSARPIDATSASIGATASWDAGTKLDAIAAADLSNRFVLSSNHAGTAGIAWTAYSALPAEQKTPLNKNSLDVVDSKGVQRVAYLRGDRSNEKTTANPSGIFRERGSRLGDIVNSNIWYTGKPASGYTSNNYAGFRTSAGARAPMIYVGANDGMLHGISTGNWPIGSSTPTVFGGQELLAYIPKGIAEGDLRKLTDIGYTHQYFVDGSPFTGDAYIGTTPAWATVLIGGLGAGGKGYFVLDVTDPNQFTTANAANLVIADTTGTTDPDIGTSMSPPVMDDAFANRSRQIVKMNGGRWAVVLGNGYNSTNEAPVLIVQYLDGDKSIRKISPCAFPTSGACSFKGTNGLSTPQLIDLDGNGTVDVAYAGDLKGNLWKFNLTSTTDTTWSVAFSGAPFFVAKPGAATQPITAAPFFKPHPLGGIMLAIGTGRNLTDADRTTLGTDTIYGIYDNSTFTSSAGVVTITDSPLGPINAPSDTSLPNTLVAQTFDTTAALDGSTNYWKQSDNVVDYAGDPLASVPVLAKRGWYLNWPIAGQRVVQNMRAFSGEKVMVQSMVPKTGSNSVTESCSASPTAERNFQTVINLYSGGRPKQPTFTFTDTSTFTPTVSKQVTMIEGIAGDTSLIYTDDAAKLLSSNCPLGQICNAKEFNTGKFIGKRAGWRVVQ